MKCRARTPSLAAHGPRHYPRIIPAPPRFSKGRRWRKEKPSRRHISQRAAESRIPSSFPSPNPTISQPSSADLLLSRIAKMSTGALTPSLAQAQAPAAAAAAETRYVPTAAPILSFLDAPEICSVPLIDWRRLHIKWPFMMYGVYRVSPDQETSSSSYPALLKLPKISETKPNTCPITVNPCPRPGAAALLP